MKFTLHDTLPEDHEYITYIKKVLRHIFRQAGYRRISTPAFERTEIYQKAFGKDSDFLNTQIYSVKNGEDSLSFKAEASVSIARMYTENKMHEWPQPVELFFIDPFYRYDEGGTFSEVLDFGAELLGVSDPALNAQILFLTKKILEELGLLEHFTIQLNHIGTASSRKVFLEDVRNFYFDKKRSLCGRCLNLVDTNPLQLFRCHEEDCAILAQIAPKLEHYKDGESKKDYEKLKEYLVELGIGFEENQSIVGDLPFHTGMRFEIWDNNKGKENILIRGGESEGLTGSLGSVKDVPMVGFQGNMESLIKNMKECGISVPKKDHLQVFVAQLGIGAKKKTLRLLEDLRDAGIQAMGAIGTGSMRVQLELAANFGVKYTLLMGEMEVKSGMVIVRDMSVGTQESVPYNRAIELMQQRIGKEKMDVMNEEEKSKEIMKNGKKKKVIDEEED